MQKNIVLKLSPSDTASEALIIEQIAKVLAVPEAAVNGFLIHKKNYDARAKQIWVNISLTAFTDEPFEKKKIEKVFFKNVSKAKHSVIIIGAGSAGLFAALMLIENGIKPIILERGKDVRSRRRDLAILNKQGIINTESNYCFGEGGAGTYSDGKLYTRSNKRGKLNRILNLFVQFGADEKILYESHPHIGTNKLPDIITAMRKQIEDCGGEFFFDKKVTDFKIDKSEINAVITKDGNCFNADAYILATGHSARDIFILLHEKKIQIEQKPFALGVRVEHPQSLIDSIQYHCNPRSEYLPPASYSFVEQIKNKGVFSFCMCPGGIIAPAATGNDELVVNGWSPSKRNNPFANSGVVVQVEEKDVLSYFKKENSEIQNPENLKMHPLLYMYFQQTIERKAYTAGGGNFIAPAQRMTDFCNNKISASLPKCSYLPGVSSADLKNVLPFFIYSSLQKAFEAFGKKRKGYFTNEAIVVATESRTSSPVRIPRNADSLHHPQIKNLYPCGEGAGYAGGIVSAAMDGEKVVAAIIQKLKK